MLKATLTAALAVATLGVATPASAAPDGLVLSAHGVVRSSTLPSCEQEDASSGPLPCTWNVNGDTGNNVGLQYWVSRQNRAHYIWAHSPVSGRRHWVSPELADALAEGGAPHADRRNWERCTVRRGHVVCPDGYREHV